MGYRLGSWNVFLHPLLFMVSHGSCQSTKVSPMVQSKDAHIEMVVHHDHHNHQHGHHMIMDDPSVVVFFTFDDLKVGNTIPIHFPKRNPSSSPHFLPRKEADSIPFSSHELPFLLRFFSFSPKSSQAVAMEETLKDCERKPAIGETKLCATSSESMQEFASGILGLDAPNIQSVSTIHLTKSDILFQNFTIMGFSEYYVASRILPCHTMPYPYAIFYCHYQKGENKVFNVWLRGDNGDTVEAVAVCHLDTSSWSQTHVAFQVLGTEPGSSSVCHFFPADHLVWIPSLI